MSNVKGMPEEMMPDECIVELYWQRDEAAIRETDRKYGAYLQRLAENILHDSRDGEECRNDTYLAVWNAIPPARPLVLQAFITRILRRVAINRYKEKTAKKQIPATSVIPLSELDEVLPDGGSPMRDYEIAELRRLLNEYMRGLSRRRRYIFIGRYYMSEPVESMAEVLGVTSSAVYKELRKLRDDLKLYLKQEGYPYD